MPALPWMMGSSPRSGRAPAGSPRRCRHRRAMYPRMPITMSFQGVFEACGYSDIGQAKVLSREYGVELKYTAATDYIRFGGQYWIESRQQAVGARRSF